MIRKQTFERGGRDDDSKHLAHTPPLWREVPLAATHALRVVGGRIWQPPLWYSRSTPLVNQALGGNENQPGLILLTWLLSAVAGGVAGLIALARDRSWLIWVAQVPGVLFFAFVIWGMSSISLGHDANPWITVPIAILMWAVFVFSLLWSVRLGRERS